MSTQFALLGLLERQPRHGYDLKRAYDTHFHRLRPLRHGQVYATLARCQRDGLVRLAGEEPGQGPDRKRYAITRAGRSALDDWLLRPEAAQTPIESTLFLKVVLSELSGRPTRAMLESQRSQHLERMRELVVAKEVANEPEVTLLDYALFHLEADLQWLDHTLRRLRRLHTRIHP